MVGSFKIQKPRAKETGKSRKSCSGKVAQFFFPFVVLFCHCLLHFVKYAFPVFILIRQIHIYVHFFGSENFNYTDEKNSSVHLHSSSS